jgi:hypothetical protein
MYVLILISVLVGGYNGPGASTHSVTGFQTNEACVAAGDAWLRQMKQLGRIGRAVCVKSN